MRNINRRHATNAILNNSPNIVRVLSGIFVHKENFSHAFQKEFEGEKATVIKLLKNKVNTDKKPLAIDDFSKELHRSGNFHRLSEKSIVAVAAAVRQISPDFRIIPQPGNSRRRCIVHKSYCQQPSKKPIEQIGASNQVNKSDIQEAHNISTDGDGGKEIGQRHSSFLDRLMKLPAPQENVRYQTWDLWKQCLKNWNLENVRISYVADKLGLEWSDKRAHEPFSDYLNLNIHEIRDLAFKSKKYEIRTMFLCVANIAERKLKIGTAETTINVSKNVSNNAIDSEGVIAWLVTQPNANGTLYLENVVRQYMGALRSAPAKLKLPAEFDVRGVFTCHTPDELNAYWAIFRAAPNYKQVNSGTSGMFSAGMGCYMRYLKHLSDELNVEKPDVVQLVERHNLEHVDSRHSGGALWVIGGRELSPTMLKLRDSGFPFTFKVGGARSSAYRDAWWHKSSEKLCEQKSEETEEAQPINKGRRGITNSVQRVDFNRPELCARTRPLTCTIKGQAVVPSKQNWTQMLVAIIERFISEGNSSLDWLDRKPLYGSKIFFLQTKADLANCCLLSNGKWVDTNHAPRAVVTIIRNLCQHCDMDLDDVIITYEPKCGKPTEDGANI